MSRKPKKEELSEAETTEESETEESETEEPPQKGRIDNSFKIGKMGNVGPNFGTNAGRHTKRNVGNHCKKNIGNKKKSQPQQKVTPVKSKPKHRPSNKTLYFPAPGYHSLAYSYTPANPNPGPYPNPDSYQDPYKQYHYPPPHYPYAYANHGPYGGYPQVTYPPQNNPQPGAGAIPAQTNQGRNESSLSKGGAQMGAATAAATAQAKGGGAEAAAMAMPN